MIYRDMRWNRNNTYRLEGKSVPRQQLVSFDAQENENGQLGKTEMWYVLDAGRDAKLVYGLKQNCTKAEMRRAIADGTVMKYLQKVPIHKDDLFFIQAGTVHAIGAGALVAEIQENSNLKKSKQRSAKVQKNI